MLILRINNLVSKLFGLCYDYWIVSFLLYLCPFLHMVYCSFTSLLETWGINHVCPKVLEPLDGLAWFKAKNSPKMHQQLDKDLHVLVGHPS